MIASVESSTLLGLRAVPISVEVDVSSGLPGLSIVGLPDKAVAESRERVRSAIRAAGMQLPPKRITVNLGPADLRKEGAGFDLAIAVAILAATGQVAPESVGDTLFLGELSLGGSLRPVRGTLSAVADAAARGRKSAVVPAANGEEAALVPDITVLPAADLVHLIDHLRGERTLPPKRRAEPAADSAAPAIDFADVRGQGSAKRSLQIAAAGGHNVLFTGPPGTGKTLLARAMPGILPPLRYAESLEVTAIYSAAGLLSQDEPLARQRPFRAPHHSISQAGLIGGGSVPRPGELTLAHRGVLFLDELPEFPRSVLEAIRGPLEDRVVRISRAQHTIEFPTDCMVLGSLNPCPCGFADDPVRPCSCSPVAVEQYRRRVSGPIRDRFDLTVEVPRLSYAEMQVGDAEPSASLQRLVMAARLAQRERFGSELKTNATMGLREVERYCAVDKAASRLLAEAVDRWQLSIRATHRVLRVGRTIADLEGATSVSDDHVAEALQYRAASVTA